MSLRESILAAVRSGSSRVATSSDVGWKNTLADLIAEGYVVRTLDGYALTYRGEERLNRDL